MSASVELKSKTESMYSSFAEHILDKTIKKKQNIIFGQSLRIHGVQ
jgi:hypothetical protein